jgi:hypothetical protein
MSMKVVKGAEVREATVRRAERGFRDAERSERVPDLDGRDHVGAQLQGEVHVRIRGETVGYTRRDDVRVDADVEGDVDGE